MAPSVPNAKLELGENCLRVLLTGFGPSPQFEVNPSWLAVQPLHDTVIPATDDQIDCADGPYRPRSIHITALQLPVSYSGVLDIIPTLHTHPPKPPDEPTSPIGENEQPAYDFIFHIGVCGRGWLRLERQAHKTGYMMKGMLAFYPFELSPIKPFPPKTRLVRSLPWFAQSEIRFNQSLNHLISLEFLRFCHPMIFLQTRSIARTAALVARGMTIHMTICLLSWMYLV